MERNYGSSGADNSPPVNDTAVGGHSNGGEHFETLAIRAGQRRTPEGEHSDPVFLTSSYVFPSAAEAAARFSGEMDGNVYSRYTNPTVAAFERRLAALEGAEAAVATSSGMAAILCTCLGLLQSGDHVVCSRSVFGATISLFGKYMERFGVRTDFVPADDIDCWKSAVTDATRLLFVESPSNPLSEIADLAALAQLAQQHNCLFAVDNCFCTPVLQRPLEWGADLVIHSATKFLDGHGRCMGGAVLGNAEHMSEVLAAVRSTGPTMSPFNAWVIHTGLETLSLRVERHCDNALKLAHWLRQRPEVETVFYAGLSDHPGHQLASRQQSGRFGAVLAFTLRGGDRQMAWKLIDSLQMISHTANLGDTKTTAVHPATTTHSKLSDEQRRESGIRENLVRIAVGLEHYQDIQNDLLRAFAALH